MKIKYEASSYKDLKRLDAKIRKKIIKKISLLPEDPYAGKKLEGKYKDLRSIRVWPFRVIYEIKDDTVVVYTIKHRQGVYRS